MSLLTLEEVRNRPSFGALIAGFALFQLADVGYKLNDSLCTLTVNTNLPTDDPLPWGKFSTEILIREQDGQPPLGLKAYMIVYDDPSVRMCCIHLMRAVVGAPNPDITVAEIYVGSTQIAAYLNELSAFLIHGEWLR